MRVRFCLDEHVAAAVARGLRSRGVDVVTVREVGLCGASDGAHLSRARREKRVVFTQDTDFLRLHAEGVQHAGIAYAPHGSSIGRVIRGLMLIHQVLDPEEMEGQIEFL